MDVYDSASTQPQPETEQKGSQASSEQTSTSQQQRRHDSQPSQSEPQSPTLEQEVQQLVGGITSWWSGVSKKSQESLAQAQSHIQSQGGILNLARKEFSHFESQISEAQARAREQSSRYPQSETSGSSDLKGKSKAKAEETLSSESHPVQIATAQAKTTEIHDVNSPGGFNDGDSDLKLDFEKSREVALKEAKNAADFASGLFSRLANETGPRMALLGRQLQDSLNKNLPKGSERSVSSEETFRGPHGTSEPDGSESGSKIDSDDQEKAQPRDQGMNIDLSQTLSSLSKTFQKSIPNLDLEKSQSLARKYLQASEKGLKEAGKEMNGLLNDLIKIVPEDGQTLRDHQQNDLASEKESIQGQNARKDEQREADVEEKIFDWDSESDHQQQVETTTGPETGNLSLNENRSSEKASKKSQEADEDDDDDDDWE